MRHEQREGRVDCFGQERAIVRATLIYGANNPVDGAVLEVILRKGETIRRARRARPVARRWAHAHEALLKAILLKRNTVAERQLALPFSTLPEAKQIDAKWTDAAERAKQIVRSSPSAACAWGMFSRSGTARSPPWGGQGRSASLRRFPSRAGTLGIRSSLMVRRGTKPRSRRSPRTCASASTQRASPTRCSWTPLPPHGRCRAVQRSRTCSSRCWPGVRCSNARSPRSPARIGSRRPRARWRVVVGCGEDADDGGARSAAASARAREGRKGRQRWDEPRADRAVRREATAIAWSGADAAVVAEGPEALRLLEAPPAGDPPAHVWDRITAQALEQIGVREPRSRCLPREPARASAVGRP